MKDLPQIDEAKVEKVIQKLHQIINKSGLNIQEILLAYGNLGYHLGASMAGFQQEGPDLETLKRCYYTDPTVDVGLMIQGMLISTWPNDFATKPKLSNLAQKYKDQKEKKQ